MRWYVMCVSNKLIKINHLLLIYVYQMNFYWQIVLLYLDSLFEGNHMAN